jgi:phytol kinase
MNEWLNVVFVLGVLLALMVGLRVWQRRRSPHAELVRKLVHIPMGLMTLAFPWLFQNPWAVTLLGGLAIAFLLALRLLPSLSTRLGSVLGGVKRRSLGEVYFSLSIVSVFWLADGQPLLFVIPMLILTLADAVAALIGVRYGQIHYSTDEGFKSAEGSLAFFMAAFFSVHIPLLLFSTTGRAETLLIAIIMGLLVMLLEAIAWRGIDNLFIPLGSFLLLQSHLTMPLVGLGIRLVATVALVLLVILWRSRTTLNDSAVLGAALMGYFAWSLGGILWLVPPLIVFLAYPLFVPWIMSPEDPLARRWFLSEWGPQPGMTHTVLTVLSVCAGGVLWLVWFGVTDTATLLYPYTLAFAGNLVVIGVAGILPEGYWGVDRGWAIARHCLTAWLLVPLPMLCLGTLLAGELQSLAIVETLLALPAMGIMAIAFYLIQPWIRRQTSEGLSYTGRAIVTILGSSLAWLPVLLTPALG